MLPMMPPAETHEATDIDVASEMARVDTSQHPLAAFAIVFGIMLVIAIIAIAASMSTGGSTDPTITPTSEPLSAPFWRA